MGKKIATSAGNVLKMTGMLYTELALSALSLVPGFGAERKTPALVRR